MYLCKEIEIWRCGDFGGDRRKGRGSLGVNTKQKWRIDRLSTRVRKVDNISPTPNVS